MSGRRGEAGELESWRTAPEVRGRKDGLASDTLITPEAKPRRRDELRRTRRALRKTRRPTRQPPSQNAANLETRKIYLWSKSQRHFLFLLLLLINSALLGLQYSIPSLFNHFQEKTFDLFSNFQRQIMFSFWTKSRNALKQIHESTLVSIRKWGRKLFSLKRLKEIVSLFIKRQKINHIYFFLLNQ